MADVEPQFILFGEVRQVESRRDFVDGTTGEVQDNAGKRSLMVLTPGGFTKVSVGKAFESVEFEEGAIIACNVRSLAWNIPARELPDGRKQAAKSGTAYLFAGFITADELSALTLAAASHESVAA